MRFALAFTVLAVLAASQSPEGQLAGVWRGQSICVRHTLTWETAPRTWLLKIQGDTMEGTLTLTDKTVVRRVTLKRDR
jgi:hypothetical protein